VVEQDDAADHAIGLADGEVQVLALAGMVSPLISVAKPA
jgi:hypothetical protein